jgi:poly(3-hydroxybutyrate) depolymerase
MKTFLAILCSFLFLGFAIPAEAQKVKREKLEFEGKSRTYYLMVPDAATPEHPAPLLVVLHGSNHNGMSLVEKWKNLAAKEGFFLVGPDSIKTEEWSIPADGPEFLHELISDLKAKYPIDSRRIYLFGHSGGAVFALYMSLHESEYFAATAIHAGLLPREAYAAINLAKRKIPIYIVVGTVDLFFPLDHVRASRDALNKQGFDVQLIEIKGHNHWYYDLAPKINADAWSFLKQQKLLEDPRYTQYVFK